MELEKFTERARGFIQAAQTIAMREGHQRLMPEHLLKSLLDDEEGQAARILAKAGGDVEAIRAATNHYIEKMPKVSGSDNIYTDQSFAKVLIGAGDLAKKHGDSFVSSETLLEALLDSKSDAKKALDSGKVNAKSLRAAIEELQQGRGVHSASAESNYEALKKFAVDLTERAREG